MKPIFLITIFYMVCFLSVCAQSNIKYYGWDSAYNHHPSDIIQTSGGFVIVGHVNWSASAVENFYHKRYYVYANNNGDTLWTRYFYHSTYGYSNIIKKNTGELLTMGTIGGAYLCGGLGTAWPYQDYYFEEISVTGIQTVYNQYSDACNNNIVDLKKDGAGGLVVFMNFDGINYQVREIDATGNVNIIPTSVIHSRAFEKANNGYWLARWNRLDKISNNGNILWSKTMTMLGFENFYKVENDSLLFIMNVGGTLDTCNVLKTDSSGNASWMRGYPMSSFHIAHHSSGNYIITGKRDGDVVVLILNSEGDSILSYEYSLSMPAYGVKTIETNNGGIAILAYTGGIGYPGQYVLILEDNLPFATGIRQQIINNKQPRLYPTLIDGRMSAYINLGEKEEGIVEFYSLEGKRLGHFSIIEGKNTLEVSRYLKTSGLYLYKVWVNQELKHTDKIIKVN